MPIEAMTLKNIAKTNILMMSQSKLEFYTKNVPEQSLSNKHITVK